MVEAWKKLKEESMNAGYRKIIRKTFQLPDGKVNDYDVIEDGDTVCIFALTSDNKVILTKQFRPGPEKVLQELPAGSLKRGDDPDKLMADELLEETGYAGELKLVGTNIDSAYSNKLRYNYVATNCKKVQEPHLEEDEFIEVVLMSVDDFKKHLETGELTDVETGYIGLKFLNIL